jgi:hypothetical protein
MHRLILVLGVVAVMSIGGRLGGEQVSVAQAAIPQPIYFWGSVAAEISAPGQSLQREVIRPSLIFLFADGSWDIEQLHWTGWGSSVAHAKGISSSSNGIPNLAQGKRIKTPGQVTLSSPGQFRGHEVYRCFTLTVSPSAPDEQRRARGLGLDGHMCLTGTPGGSWGFGGPTTTTTPTTTPPVKADSPPVAVSLPKSALTAVERLACNGTPSGCPAQAGGYASVCNQTPQWSLQRGCPVTPRLQKRLLKFTRGADPVCRCQNSPLKMSFTVISAKPTRSLVNASYYDWFRETFVAVKQGQGWLVSDIYCAGKPSTSLYAKNPGPC